MRFCIIALSTLALVGCAPDVSGTEAGGVAQWYGASPAPAVTAANVHCQKFGKVARPNQIQTWGGYVAFSCEKPGS